MKKIGVITFHKSENYGAFLQCYALQKTLTRMGYDSSVINYVNPADKKKFRLIKTSSLKAFTISILSLIPNVKRKRNFKKALKKITLSDKNDLFDVAIAGSDQIWNPTLSDGHLDSYYTLHKINANQKISYAASLGNAKYVFSHKKDFSRILDELNYISVREMESAKELSKLTNKNISVNIDPTLLLTKKEWINELSLKSALTEKYILSYFIGNKPLKILAKISDTVKMRVISYSAIPREKSILKRCFSDGPLDFIEKLYKSELVVTSSFHGVVFSIIFNKDFYVITPKKENRSRIDNILKLLDIKDRVVEDISDMDSIKYKKIDYKPINKKLTKLRRESLSWLEKAIESANEK